MSIATDFETFCKNIKMDERTVETISTRYIVCSLYWFYVCWL